MLQYGKYIVFVHTSMRTQALKYDKFCEWASVTVNNRVTSSFSLLMCFVHVTAYIVTRMLQLSWCLLKGNKHKAETLRAHVSIRLWDGGLKRGWFLGVGEIREWEKASNVFHWWISLRWARASSETLVHISITCCENGK